MRTVNIQQILDNPDATGAVRLPHGEFEGPFYINRPCVVVGNNTTLWAKDGPVVTINSHGAALKDLRVEITDNKTARSISVATNSQDSRFSNVEIIGSVKGVAGEECEWGVPKVVNLKKFPADRKNTFTMEVIVPVKTLIKCSIYDLKISPLELNPGKNTITITTESLRSGSFIYGEILFVSAFIRRMYISGSADDSITSFADGEKVFDSSLPVKPHRSIEATPVVSVLKHAEPAVKDGMAVIKRGQRVLVTEFFNPADIEIELTYSNMLIQMDIDPYVFMLDKNNLVVSDDRLVFFGNSKSGDGSVTYQNLSGKNTVKLNLNSVAEDIDKISVTYSIYGDNPNHNFSKVVNPLIVIKSNGEKKASFNPDGLLLETTIVALEFYRYNNSWKLSTVGHGYREGLKRLCESFGLNIIS